MVFSLQPIPRPRSLCEQVYQSLYEAILSGGMSPGERLVETKLAQQFNVSRTPIREAIRQLQLKGLVQQNQGGGMYVIQISLEDALHLYDCRMALEQLAVRHACQQVQSPDLNQIEQTLAAMEQTFEPGEAIAQDQTEQHLNLLSLNFQFHGFLATYSRNPWILPLLEQVFEKITLLQIRASRTADDLAAIHAEHRDVFEAIARQNEQAAIAAITNHLSVSKDRIRRYTQGSDT